MANVIATNLGEFGTAATDFFENVGGSNSITTAAYATIWANGNGRALAQTNNSGVQRTTKNVPSQQEYFAHVRVRRGDASTTLGLLCFQEGSIDHIDIVQISTGAIAARRGGTIIATGTTIFPMIIGTVLSVQARVKIDNTTGVVQVRINGSSVNEIDFSGDTQNAGTTAITRIGFVLPTTDIAVNYTDFVVNDTTGAAETSWTGAIRVILGALTITGGSGVQWTPLSSTNVSNIDDTVPGAHDGETTYNEDSTAGHKDWFQVASSVFTGMSPASIRFVRTKYWMRAADGGSHTARSNAKNGGTTVNGTTINLGSSYDRWEDVYYTDPATGSAWANFAAIYGAEFGYELVS
jgi:hypothetical protein